MGQALRPAGVTSHITIYHLTRSCICTWVAGDFALALH